MAIPRMYFWTTMRPVGKVTRTAICFSVKYGAGMLLWLCSGCVTNEQASMNFTEKQLTYAAHGHTLHHIQVFSQDDQWVVYDTRNDDTQIGSTSTIAMVHTGTGEIKVLYQTENQTAYGPGVGAATFSPVADTVLFIHGIRNADAARPYSMTRRTGVAIDIGHPQQPVFMDARDIKAPYTPGALRGGTHAHSWSGDGQWICFTYNDDVLEQLAVTDAGVADLRTVGVMVPGRVEVANDPSMECNSGERFAVVAAMVTENPGPGSDDIDKAFDECWIGTGGYLRPDGSRQAKAIAFQGNVRDSSGATVTEVFVLDLPDELTIAREGAPLEGTPRTRPGVPEGVVQRRITYTGGISGPRHWLRSTPDGSTIFFLAADERGVVQLFAVSPNGGEIRPVTRNSFAIQGPFTVSPDGRWVTYIADNSVYVTHLLTGETHRVTRRFDDDERPVGGPCWSNSGQQIAYNRYVQEGEERFLQIFLLTKQ